MNYLKIDKCDLNNGDGCRVVLWLSGCSHKCAGCHNVESWNPDLGELFSKESLELLNLYLSDSAIQGLTITGGDPFFVSNRDEVLRLCKSIKSYFNDKDIWIWTGYKVEELVDVDLGNIDYIIDGRFESELYNKSLKYRGSENQNRYLIKKGVAKLID